MSLFYRYRLQTRSAPVVPLGGRWSRPRPIIDVTILGPSDSRLLDALLDSGADDTVFPERVASVLGIDLANALPGVAEGAGGMPIPVRYAQATLRITDGVEQREWTAWVAFTSARMNRPLLGFAGFLQFFTATFHGDREEVELTVNSLYPGT